MLRNHWRWLLRNWWRWLDRNSHLDGQNRHMLLEIMEDRHGNRSTIITSQLPVAKWYDIIGEQTIADAILDRIVHDAHRIELFGESLRKRYGMKKEMNLISMQ